MASNSSNRKRNSLPIEKKVELSKKLDMDSSVSSVCEFYDVGKSTVYDLIKKKLKFRKTLHKPRINTVP